MQQLRQLNLKAASLMATGLGVLWLPISVAFADSSVWKVSKGDDHIFLGGTVHILSESDYPLPDEFAEAYSASDLVVFETDIEGMKDPVVAQMIMSKMSYSDGSTIEDHLKPETIDAIKAHLEHRGMTLEAFANFKPSLLYIVLTSIELGRIGINVEGVDAFYSAKAASDDKGQLMLETVEEQMSYVIGIGADDPDKLFEYGLQDLAGLGAMMESLVEDWREGDTEGLGDQLTDLLAKDYPKMYQSLIVERNNNWMPHIIGYFETSDIEFVMVGAGHLVGEVGLLELLRLDGYSVEQL